MLCVANFATCESKFKFRHKMSGMHLEVIAKTLNSCLFVWVILEFPFYGYKCSVFGTQFDGLNVFF